MRASRSAGTVEVSEGGHRDEPDAREAEGILHTARGEVEPAGVKVLSKKTRC